MTQKKIHTAVKRLSQHFWTYYEEKMFLSFMLGRQTCTCLPTTAFAALLSFLLPGLSVLQSQRLDQIVCVACGKLSDDVSFCSIPER